MIFNRLAEDVFKNDYFKDLYIKLNIMMSNEVFKCTENIFFTEKEFKDLLRFADVLSNATNEDARNMSYKIIALLNLFYIEHPIYKSFSTAVLSKLGNFPAMKLLDYNVELPFERQVEKQIKIINQTIDESGEIILTDSQHELFTKIKGTQNYSFSGPTSMGKSFIIKSVIRHILQQQDKGHIVVIVPTRALIHQFAIDIRKDLEQLLRQEEYIVLTNGMIPSDKAEGEQKQYIFVLTAERLISCLAESPGLAIKYLFIDEAHKLAANKDSRSVTLYSAIEKVTRTNPYVKLYFASPNVSNPEVFLNLFDKDSKDFFKTNESPVSQNLFFIDLLRDSINQFTEFGEIEVCNDNIKNSGIVTVAELIHFLSQGTSNLIYCNSVSETVSKAIEFSEEYANVSLNYHQNLILKQTIEAIGDVIHQDYYLIDCLKNGVAYHFGKLPQIVRNNIESLFKEGIVKYLFCTSTLLEGVNLPAKNVFILKNKRGMNNFTRIDFLNLAGRAGRLNYELAGNIFCIRGERADWIRTDILHNEKEEPIIPTVTKNVEERLQQIEEAIVQNEIKYGTNQEKEILHYLANVICIDTLELKDGYRSPVIDKLIKDNKFDIVRLARKSMEEITVPQHILKTNSFIMARYQQSAYRYIMDNQLNKDDICLTSTVNFNTCLKFLEILHDIYGFEKEEKELRNKKKLRYYAMLMNNWINGASLKKMINNSLEYKNSREKFIQFYENGMWQRELFDISNRKHVNLEINNLISDIEGVLRFTIQKYFNHYYLLLVEVFGKENAGENWANYLEYGTKNPNIIILQNMGLSRYVAMKIMSEYKRYLEFEEGRIIRINREALLKELDDFICKSEISALV